MVAFLGNIVSSKGIDIDPKKTDAFNGGPKPLTLTNSKSFLGLGDYYRRSVKVFFLH